MIGIFVVWTSAKALIFFASFFLSSFESPEKENGPGALLLRDRFPLYNLMKICESVINRFQSSVALFSLIDDTKVRAFWVAGQDSKQAFVAQ